MRPNAGGRVLALALLPLLLMLGGCVKLETDVVISPDDTVDMTMLLAIQEGYAATVDTLCEQDGAGGTVSTYDADGYVGCLREVKGAPLSALSDDNLDLSIVHADGEYRFSMMSSEIGVSTGGDERLIASLFTDFRVSVTFPGEVTTHNGSSTVDGTTVTWTDASDMASGEGLRATADEATSLLRLLPWLGAGLLVVAGVVIGIMLLRRPRAAQPYPPLPQPLAPPPGQGYPAPGQGYPPGPGSPTGSGYPTGQGYPTGLGYPTGSAGQGPPGGSGNPSRPAGYPPPSGHPSQQQPPRIGDYADPSYLDAPEAGRDQSPPSPWSRPPY